MFASYCGTQGPENVPNGRETGSSGRTKRPIPTVERSLLTITRI